MTFATITPTRGDRPEFLEFCKHQLSRMTVKPDKSYFVDYKPVSKEVDLIARVKAGIQLARNDGFTKVFIIEDDDYYPADYFETMNLDGCHFVGSLQTIYYSVRSRQYQEINHSHRSSLFLTGFHTDVLKKFKWPRDNKPGLDLELWKHAYGFTRKFIETKAIGIKHGVGLCAGAGHWKTLKQHDHDMEWLKQRVDSEAFIFYKSVKL